MSEYVTPDLEMCPFPCCNRTLIQMALCGRISEVHKGWKAEAAEISGRHPLLAIATMPHLSHHGNSHKLLEAL
jgi:hypothetical protein